MNSNTMYRDISADEELLVYYSDTYFKNDCVCDSCQRKPQQSSQAIQNTENDETNGEDDEMHDADPWQEEPQMSPPDEPLESPAASGT